MKIERKIHKLKGQAILTARITDDDWALAGFAYVNPNQTVTLTTMPNLHKDQWAEVVEVINQMILESEILNG